MSPFLKDLIAFFQPPAHYHLELIAIRTYQCKHYGAESIHADRRPYGTI
jgi:hypothetical protein